MITFAPTAAIANPPLVLVVDDHEDSRIIAKLVLESVGFRVTEARTGTEALREARRTLPTVMLLDIVLPEIDGWEIARRLRGDERTRGIGIIALTALSAPEDLAYSLIAGCDDVLTKPVHPSTLLATLERYVGLPKPRIRRAIEP